MKKTHIIFLSLFAIITLLISCNKYDDNYNYQNPTEQDNNNNNDDDNNNNNDDDDDDDDNVDYISQIVYDNIYVSVKYQNYGYNITGYTSINSALSGHEIKYGIQCGYTDIPDMYYSRYIDNLSGSIDYTEPIFIDINKDPYTTLCLYWKSYMYLIKMTDLSPSEQELFNAILEEFNKYEYSIKSKYWGRLFVEVDGKQYIIKNFGVSI